MTVVSSTHHVSRGHNSDTLSSTHPLYDCRLEQWQRCRDCWAGQDAVKARDGGRRYLPPTEGMVHDGVYDADPKSLGKLNYNAYLTRALFHSFYADAVGMILGLLGLKPPVFEGLTGPLEYISKRATIEGESIDQLLNRIYENQIAMGRLGLLVDLPQSVQGIPQPYIALYNCEDITNWDAGYRGEINETLNLVVLNESGVKRDGLFSWEDHTQYRVLLLGPGETNEAAGVYRLGVFAEEGRGGDPLFDESFMFSPEIQGRTLNQIPFTFINATSTTSKPCDPPLLGVADHSLAMYRLEADYRAELHASTQATLVTKGMPQTKGHENKPLRVGAGAHIDLGDQQWAEAKYLEVSGRGLPELRVALENDRKLIQSRAGEIVDTSSRSRESGDAMEMRIGARTASLTTIATHGAVGLERMLKITGRWLGMSDADVEKIKVWPNLKFQTPSFDSLQLKALVESRMLGGAAISLESIHKYLTDHNYTSMPFEELVAQCEKDAEYISRIAPGLQASLDLAGPQNGGAQNIPPSSTGV